MNANLALRLTEHARKRPDATAIITWRNGGHRAWTFSEIDQASRHAASLFVRFGLLKGETVLLWQPMSAELYILMIGAWRAGLAVMFIDPGQPLAMREACARIIQPRALAGPWTAHAWVHDHAHPEKTIQSDHDQRLVADGETMDKLSTQR